MQTQKLMDHAIDRHLKGHFNAASEIYSTILSQQPDHAEAWNLSGVLAHQMGRHSEGIELLAHAISLREDEPVFYYNLATALLADERYKQAETCSRKCLELDPKHVLAWTVLGKALQSQDLLTEAGDCFEQCLQLAPNHSDAMEWLGVVRRSQDRHEEAILLFKEAIKQSPESTEALINLGITYYELGRYKEAETAYLAVIQKSPTHCGAWNNLASHYMLFAQTTEAFECYRQALQHTPAEDPLHALVGSNYLYALNLTGASRADCFEAHTAIARMMPPEQPQAFTNSKTIDRQLRIGYLSPDFRKHPLVSFIEPILKNHSTSDFSIFGYANVKNVDHVTDRLQTRCTNWRSIYGVSDQDAIAMIMEDEIDILVDLAGHTANNRMTLFAQRAAPVQVSMLGYLNTTGLGSMDYVVTDEVRDPPAEDKFYSESVVRLSKGGCCWTPPDNTPDIMPPPVLERKHITFGSMHRPNKLTDETLRLWANVMNAVPNSRLLVFHNVLRKSEALQSHVLAGIRDAGVDLDRVDVAWNDTAEYLMAYDEMDILLEATPWSSGTTALESLWQGVPIPTIYGRNPSGRATPSVLKRLGLDDLVAASEVEYVDIVAKLAANPERLSDLRGGLRPLIEKTICNATSFVQQLEDSYRDMWKKACHEA